MTIKTTFKLNGVEVGEVPFAMEEKGFILVEPHGLVSLKYHENGVEVYTTLMPMVAVSHAVVFHAKVNKLNVTGIEMDLDTRNENNVIYTVNVVY